MNCCALLFLSTFSLHFIQGMHIIEFLLSIMCMWMKWRLKRTAVYRLIVGIFTAAVLSALWLIVGTFVLVRLWWLLLLALIVHMLKSGAELSVAFRLIVGKFTVSCSGRFDCCCSSTCCKRWDTC